MEFGTNQLRTCSERNGIWLLLEVLARRRGSIELAIALTRADAKIFGQLSHADVRRGRHAEYICSENLYFTKMNTSDSNNCLNQNGFRRIPKWFQETNGFSNRRRSHYTVD